ncbi:N-lysine methyltransferase KMT5A-like [Cebus imitator]|uniref:N-lysine methyltransferase KMT5A-like n=1 Tax=Cebus imitator TaxID=2715852 RepID=UPI000809B2AE|nr:N-lysine methyltransferase KMT5A-like [Cebus imitator]
MGRLHLFLSLSLSRRMRSEHSACASHPACLLQAARGCRGAQVPGPASPAMVEGGAVGRWWRRRLRRRGAAPMGLAGLQEENAVVTHHEVKCQGKPLAGIYRKPEEKRNAGNAARSAVKSEEQKMKDARGGPLAPFPNQKSEAAEPPKTPPSSCHSANAAVAKKSPSRANRPTPKKSSRKKTQQNCKLMDCYPVRRSSRKSNAELQSEERKRIDELIESGKEEGMKIDLIDGKGRGVIATKQFSRGDFVVEDHGDLTEITDAKKREALCPQDPSTGCYMYYFQYLSKASCSLSWPVLTWPLPACASPGVSQAHLHPVLTQPLPTCASPAVCQAHLHPVLIRPLPACASPGHLLTCTLSSGFHVGDCMT